MALPIDIKFHLEQNIITAQWFVSQNNTVMKTNTVRKKNRSYKEIPLR